MSTAIASPAAGSRNLQIDTLRGLACLLLVAFHVVGFNENLGLRLSDGPLRVINDLLGHLRMPLFTFLSGIVYAWRPSRQPLAFLRGKARRLLLPLLTVGTLFAVIQALVPDTNSSVRDWHMLHLLPVGHYWYLEALFLIFVLVALFESLGLLATRRGFTLVFAAAVLFSLFGSRSPYFGFNGMLYLLPYFLAGLGIQRFGLAEGLDRRAAVVMLGAVLAILLLIGTGLVDNPPRISISALAIGLLGCTALLRLDWQWHWLARIGYYSYGIFLFHVFFSAGTRILLYRLGVEAIAPHFVLGLTAGILGPILLEKVLQEHRLGRTLLLGQAWHTRPAPQQAASGVSVS